MVRGGLPIAKEIEKVNPSFAGLTLRVAAQRIFHPDDPMLAIGAVSASQTWLHDEILRLWPASTDRLAGEVGRAWRLLLAESYQRDNQWSSALAGVDVRSVAIIDDVIATGATMAAVNCAIRSVASPDIVAFIAPVAFTAACDGLRDRGGEVHTLHEASRTEPFVAGSYFADFSELLDGQSGTGA